MKHLFYILIGLFVLCFSANDSYGQFRKSKKRDAFSGKSKKGPNIYTAESRSGKKSKDYGTLTSKKKRKGKGGATFSSTKRRYKSVNSKPKGKGSQSGKSATGGRKSGKGRKKASKEK